MVTRQEKKFGIAFVAQNGTRQSLPGMIDDGKLEIDYNGLGPQGAIIKKLADSIGSHLSFAYRKSDDSLVLRGPTPRARSVSSSTGRRRSDRGGADVPRKVN